MTHRVTKRPEDRIDMRRFALAVADRLTERQLAERFKIGPTLARRLRRQVLKESSR